LFSSLHKSKTAAAKAAQLSPIETALLDMAVTAAFNRPDSYLSLVAVERHLVETKVFEIYVIQIECAVMSLVFGSSGRIALLDFVLTCPLLEEVPTHQIV
jgi:hypothetical protein